MCGNRHHSSVLCSASRGSQQVDCTNSCFRSPTLKISKKEIDSQFRSLTTLMYADIQLLKAGKYDQLISKLRNRFKIIMAVAVCLGFALFKWAFPEDPPEPAGQATIVGMALIVLLWEASRLHKLSGIETFIDSMTEETLTDDFSAGESD